MSKQTHPAFKGKVLDDSGMGIHYFGVGKRDFPKIEALEESESVIEIYTKQGSVIGAIDHAYMGARGPIVALNIHD